jgi:hypothetical protein
MVTKGRDVKPMMLGHVHGKEGFLGSSDTTAIVGFIVATKVGSGVGVKSYSIMEQGRVDHILSLKPPERRILIEEVAGISIYEMRKKHSLNELEKTELRLKEAAAILRERNAYLRNLEDERKQLSNFHFPIQSSFFWQIPHSIQLFRRIGFAVY